MDMDMASPPGNHAAAEAGETIITSQVDGAQTGIIKIIQLRRPQAKNALSQQMVRELSAVVEDIHQHAYDDDEQDDDQDALAPVRALVLGSAVAGIFCGGADLKERAGQTPSATRGFLAALRHLLTRLAALPVPAVACVAGPALGGGLELALACHLRVFARNAAAGLPETARLAIVPGAGATHRLPRVVGPAHALDLILTGRRVDADEAFRMGLCNRLVPAAGAAGDAIMSPDMLRREALEAGVALARQITAGGPVAVRAALGVLGGAVDALENAAYESVLGTEDRDEALRAFAEKRAPRFVGR